MNKKYLIHGISLSDDTIDGKKSLDIAISNIEVTDDDILCDTEIYLTDNETGMTQGSEFSEVSLTGAGSGGGDYTTANVTIIPLVNGEPITGIENCYTSGTFPEPLDTVTFGFPNFSTFPFVIIIPSSGYLLAEIGVQDSDGLAVWDGNEPVEITGDAEYADNIITIMGDCTLKLNMWLD